MIPSPANTCTYLHTRAYRNLYTCIHSARIRATGGRWPVAQGRLLSRPAGGGVSPVPRVSRRSVVVLRLELSAATPPKERFHSLCFTCRGRSRFRRVSFASVLRIKKEYCTLIFWELLLKENKFLCEDNFINLPLASERLKGRGGRRLLQRARPGTHSFLPQPPPDTLLWRPLIEISFLLNILHRYI